MDYTRKVVGKMFKFCGTILIKELSNLNIAIVPRMAKQPNIFSMKQLFIKKWVSILDKYTCNDG